MPAPQLLLPPPGGPAGCRALGGVCPGPGAALANASHTTPTPGGVGGSHPADSSSAAVANLKPQAFPRH